MGEFAVGFVNAIPSLLIISAMVTWLVSIVTPTIGSFGLSDHIYAVTVRVVAAVVGIVIAGLLGNPNVFAGVVFYGAPIPSIIGMLATAILASAGSNAIHEIGTYLGSINSPAVVVSKADVVTTSTAEVSTTDIVQAQNVVERRTLN